MAAPTTAACVKKALANPEPWRCRPAAAAAGFWGAPVASVMRPTADGCDSLTQANNWPAGVRYRSKLFHAGREARRRELTHSGGSTPPAAALQKARLPLAGFAERLWN